MYILFELRKIAKAKLVAFGEQHPQIMSSIEEWYQVAKSKEVDWQKPQDVVDTFGAKRVDILKNNRVCIDVAGNHIRIILKVNYAWSMAYVRWIGWHKDYDLLGDLINSI